MSYFDDASLVMIPSGTKTSKVYSVKPIDGTGDLTFSRSNDTATRVASNGLIEKVRTNLYLYSEQIDNAIWSKVRGSVTANSTTAPDGTLTADTFTEDTTSGTHDLRQSLSSTSGIPYFFSIYVKANGRTDLDVFVGGASVGANFDLASGTVTGGSAPIKTIVNAGNGWWRVGVGCVALTSTTTAIWILNNGTTQSYTGDGVSGMYYWAAQAETGDIATDYIATTTAAVSVGPVANVPRLDYLGSSCPRLLLEPQRTNILLYSEQFDNAAWSKSAVTITANDITSPDGYTNADKMAESATTSGHYILQSPTLTAAAYTFAIFAKAGERNWFLFRQHTLGLNASFNLATGTLGTIAAGLTATIEDYGNDWYRCSVTFTGTAAAHSFRLYVTTADNSTSSYLGDGTSGLYLYGAGCELGSYPTSYVGPTLGAAVTRGADLCNKDGVGSLFGTNIGSFFLDAEGPYYDGAAYLFDLSDNATTGTNRLAMYSGGTTFMTFYTNAVHNITTSVTARKKIAVIWNGTNTKVYLNGAKVLDFTYANANPTSINLSSRFTDESFGNSKFNQVLAFPTALTDAQAIELTTI